ncbi:hypothetical protein WN944_022625 [Citrus x changshan-huyou]|uniref:Uncharacterized protein n=1 Tax=Citrus x changshan-huyou TaxID=2935761 RepID=A0AAP0N1H7_9ROSI
MSFNLYIVSNTLPIGGGAAKRLKEAQALETSRRREEMIALGSSFQYESSSSSRLQTQLQLHQQQQSAGSNYLQQSSQNNNFYNTYLQNNPGLLHGSGRDTVAGQVTDLGKQRRSSSGWAKTREKDVATEKVQICCKFAGQWMKIRGGRECIFAATGSRKSLIARMVIIHELPLRFVEYKGFREMITHANPVVKPMSRNTLKNEILKLCHIEKCEPQYKSLPSDSEWDLTATMVEHLRSFYMLTKMFSDEHIEHARKLCHDLVKEYELKAMVLSGGQDVGLENIHLKSSLNSNKY